MAKSVTLPKLGESVTEGTIIRWLKQEGEWVNEDEMLFEISTDKIDTEVPSPASGIVSKIMVGPDETVAVGTEVAVIDETAQQGGGAGAQAAAASTPAQPAAEQAPSVEQDASAASSEPKKQPSAKPATPEKPAAAAAPALPKAASASAPPKTKAAPQAAQRPSEEAAFASPIVRKLAREQGVNVDTLRGTGPGGRITKDDVLAAANGKRATPAATTSKAAAPARAPVPASQFAIPDGEYQDVPFTRVRTAIAEHMVKSLQTAAQLTNVVEVDMTRVAQLRDGTKEAFKAREGFSLTYMPFIASAVVEAIRSFPEFNATVLEDGKTARLLREVNLGVAVGRDEGLIVPVVHGADGMNLIGLARAIHDVGTRARTKGGLKPDDVTGGTFSITNYGSFGGLIDTPIINQPQVAIIGIGAVTKRPAVVSIDGADAIAVRSLVFLSLTYDHRWIDGHKAGQFNARIKQILEEADFAHELLTE